QNDVADDERRLPEHGGLGRETDAHRIDRKERERYGLAEPADERGDEREGCRAASGPHAPARLRADVRRAPAHGDERQPHEDRQRAPPALLLDHQVDPDFRQKPGRARRDTLGEAKEEPQRQARGERETYLDERGRGEREPDRDDGPETSGPARNERAGAHEAD